jgi:hypothetical protein
MRRSQAAWLAALAVGFLFRLAYGLSSIFWTEDERQVYLIGLRSFARGEWPYFGADVVWTQSQLPGALQAWLVRAPLEIWPAPEAPIVFLNVLSFATLSLLAWYLSRRVADVPRWLIWAGLLTLPWTLNFSTHIVNTSYILPGAIVFFVGFLEAAPSLRAGVLPRFVAWLCLGAGLLYLIQVHMSWVLLPAYIAFAGIDLSIRERRGAGTAAVAFAAGAFLTGSLLLPTLRQFGFSALAVGSNIEMNLLGIPTFVEIMARFLSFASFEMNRFLGLSTADRLLFLFRQIWVVPFAALVVVVGLLQPIAMAATWFRHRQSSRPWLVARRLAAATVVWVFLSFFASVRGPLAHAFYIVFPLAALYAVECWRVWTTTPRPQLERLAMATLVAGVLLHAALAIDRWPRQSLYRNRALVQTAITTRNDRLLGDRRDSIHETQDRRPRPSDPVPDADAYLTADPRSDLAAETSWSARLANQVSCFRLSLTNRSRTAAYVDVRYVTEYVGADGRAIEKRDGVIKEIIQPGERRTWEAVTDRAVPRGAVGATLTIVGAEKVIPAPRGP